QFSRAATVSATYLYSRGLHEFLSSNINAFDPATYNPETGSGTRPNGINENIYQFQSGGIYKQNEVILNYSVNAKRVTLFGFYELNFANADTSGAGYFPTNGADPALDYGRATFDIHHRFLLGGNLQGPYGIGLSPMLSMNSGAPFDITIGQDLNGDNQFNDRPAWASASSTKTMTTPYGSFDLAPAWNAPRIPYNLGTGPGQVSLNLRLSKSFGIGPRVAGGQGGFGGGFRGGPGGGPPRGGMGGGLGPGGLSGGGPGFMGMNNNLPRRYSLSFSAMAHNLFNNVNLAPPNGVLESPLFGQSTALAGGFFSSGAYNRSIDLQMSFSF
ncbi:MAG: carboxypeptidase regulatory-like domain-containing protein, partial [Acidobacteriota bacterium]